MKMVKKHITKYVLLSTADQHSAKIAVAAACKNVAWMTSLGENEKADKSFLENAKYVFVGRWPKIIPDHVLNSGPTFIGFHTSNLPEGRGGSPIQNQILENVISSKVNAIRIDPNASLDSGPVYASRPITLQGTADDIWSTIAELIPDMINEIIENNQILPVNQGDRVFNVYKRRKNNCIEEVASKEIDKVFRFIQMLDGEGYPRAFVDVGNYRIEFDRASMKNGQSILCDANIRKIK